MTYTFFNEPIVRAGAVLGCALVGAALLFGLFFKSARSAEHTLSSTGSAKETVAADSARWVVRVERIVFEGGILGAYGQVSADTAKVKKFLSQNGIAESEVSVSPISVEDYYGPGYDTTRRVAVRQSITVRTEDVARIQTVSQNTLVLAQQGVLFSPQAPEYLVTNLPDIRVRLLGKAVQDAKARADEIAGAMGQRAGRITTASSGVVQVMAPGSIDVSDYGQYDTSTIEKDVMVTARVTFELR